MQRKIAIAVARAGSSMMNEPPSTPSTAELQISFMMDTLKIEDKPANDAAEGHQSPCRGLPARHTISSHLYAASSP
jgi:hypothetical protein